MGNAIYAEWEQIEGPIEFRYPSSLYSSEEKQQTHQIVTLEIAGAAPVRTAKVTCAHRALYLSMAVSTTVVHMALTHRM